MKWIYRIVTIAIIGVAFGMPFFIDNKQGKPMLSLPDFSDLKPESLVPSRPKTTGVSTFYKWQDKHGQWHYSDQPPAPEKPFELITVNANTNIIPAIPSDTVASPASLSASESPQEPSHDAQQGRHPETTEDVLTLENALNLVEDTHKLKDSLDQRNRALESQF